MNDQIKKLWTITSSILILMFIFVPYVQENCNTRICVNSSGYTFVGSLEFSQIINIPLLLLELLVVLIISGSYYLFAIKDK